MDVIEVKVGIADLKTTESPNRLITIGLGSCIGIALYDEKNGIGGLAHIMLPDSNQFSNITNPMKFADLSIPILLDKLVRNGALKRNVKSKIAGGASMFNFSDKSLVMDIGKRNGEAVKSKLDELGIPVVSEDIGGGKGRTMILDVASGAVQIKTVGCGIKEI